MLKCKSTKKINAGRILPTANAYRTKENLMKTLNRAFLYVHPTEKFWKLVGPLVEDKDFIAFHEPTIYLIDEDIWDEETVIKKYMKMRFHLV